MSYKDEITSAMQSLAYDPKIRFVGYGVKVGGQALGTLKEINEEQLVETPVAENLMVGMAIGMSLAGLKPVVFIERMDFILNALDAIVNHLSQAKAISRGEFSPAMILRVVVGNRAKPLFTGPTHTQDFSQSIAGMVGFPVRQVTRETEFAPIYEHAKACLDRGESTMVVEYKDLM